MPSPINGADASASRSNQGILLIPCPRCQAKGLQQIDDEQRCVFCGHIVYLAPAPRVTVDPSMLRRKDYPRKVG